MRRQNTAISSLRFALRTSGALAAFAASTAQALGILFARGTRVRSVFGRQSQAQRLPVVSSYVYQDGARA